MSKRIKYIIAIYGVGLFGFLLGLSLNDLTPKGENIRYLLMFSGFSIVLLNLGLSWKQPTFGGGWVHKYASIAIGILTGIYSIHLFIKLFFNE